MLGPSCTGLICPAGTGNCCAMIDGPPRTARSASTAASSLSGSIWSHQLCLSASRIFSKLPPADALVITSTLERAWICSTMRAAPAAHLPLHHLGLHVDGEAHQVRALLHGLLDQTPTATPATLETRSVARTSPSWPSRTFL